MSTKGDLLNGAVQEEGTALRTLPASHQSRTDTNYCYDHGFTAWSQVFVSHLLVINGFGYFSAFGLFQPHWESFLGRSSSDIAWIGSLQLSLLFFVGTFSGRAMDAGYFRSLLAVGCCLQVLGVFTTSVVSRYWQLVLSQGLAQGLGNGLLFTPLVTLVSTYFKERRAVALALAACGAPVGGVIFSLISRQLESVVSFAWVIRIMGFIILFNIILIAALARPRQINRLAGPVVEWQAFRELQYSLYALGIFFTLWGLYIAYFYTATFGNEVVRIPSSTSLVLLMVLNGAGILGRLIPALLADLFFGSFNTLIPFVFCVSISLYCWIAVTSVNSYLAFVVFYGICANAVQTLFPSTLSNLTTDVSKMGVRTGMVFTICSFACLTGPPIAGVLIKSAGGTYRYAQLFGGTTVLVGALLLLTARNVRVLRLQHPANPHDDHVLEETGHQT